METNPSATRQQAEIKRKAGRPKVHMPAELIRALKDQGLSLRKIAAATGYGYGSVRRVLASHPRPTEPKQDSN